MKAVLIFAALFLLSCGASNDFKKAPPDTVFTTTTYFNGKGPEGYTTATTMKIRKDSLAPSADSVKLTWKRDSIYLVPIRMDSVLGDDGKVKRDSLGKPIPGFVWTYAPKEVIVHDFNKIWPK